MTDHIVLQGVTARGFHGVLEAEKADGQDFVVDVTLEVDLRRAGRSDLLGHTVTVPSVNIGVDLILQADQGVDVFKSGIAYDQFGHVNILSQLRIQGRHCRRSLQ